jgi:homogentisate 1,2-dioxygenase
MEFPQVKGRVTRQAHVRVPEGTWEEEHARRGFFGRTAHLYHLNMPTAWTRIEGPLRPRCFAGDRLDPPDRARPEGTALRVLHNDDASVWISRRRRPMPYFYRNADGDDVVFVHQGRGRVETDYGPLAFEPGDYLWLPKGTTYRVVPDGPENFFLVVEAREFTWPDRGLLGQHAFIDPAMVETPEPEAHDERGQFELRVKRLGVYTSFFYEHHPLDVVGWKGDLAPVRFNVRDLRPVMSPRYHVAPTVHSTLVSPSCAICTFVPRPFESDPDAQRVPFYHRNIDYDELIFYHAGEFFSRHGIGPGALTLHPQGIHHGPHPRAFEAARAKTGTNEVAVLVETTAPLRIAPEAEQVEVPEYATSWASALREIEGGGAG